MGQKTRVEVDKARVLKTVRSLVRLKHSIAADAELNTVLPWVEQEFDKAFHEGRAFELDTDVIFREDMS